MVYLGIGVLAVLLVVFYVIGNFETRDSEEGVVLSDVNEEGAASLEEVPAPVPPIVTAPAVPSPPVVSVNFQNYNIDYMNDNIKGILVGRMGNAKTDFYLPPTGYVNVSRGTKYGVAFVIQNVNPKVPEGNSFVYNFKVNPSSVVNCGVKVSEAQGWIERGWSSSGMISGQWREDWHEWYDAMTIYFAFPEDVKPCNIKYDFVITRDGADYDSRVLEFNLI